VPFLAFFSFSPPPPQPALQGELYGQEACHLEWQCSHCGAWGDTIGPQKAIVAHWIGCQRRLVDRQRHAQLLRTGKAYPLRNKGAR